MVTPPASDTSGQLRKRRITLIISLIIVAILAVMTYAAWVWRQNRMRVPLPHKVAAVDGVRDECHVRQGSDRRLTVNLSDQEDPNLCTKPNSADA
jgi:flagellar basal body-associated protein FliL